MYTSPITKMSYIHPSTLYRFTIILLLSSSLIPLDHPFVESTTTQTILSDKEALISFRSQLTLGSSPNPLSTWDQNSSPCNWTRVECDKLGNRVIGLDLSSLQLSGSISPYIANISFLESLQLQNNHLIGTIPNELGNLLHLKVLNLSSNNLGGVIPSNITNLRELNVLDLARNLITGPIPKSIGNISSLITLDLGTNLLKGSIPHELSRLTSLKHLDLSINNLSGLVPPKIYNMSSLEFLALASNNLWGDIPYNVGQTLPNLLVFYFCINKFTGKIPGSLQNLTNIQVIRMAHNRLTGDIPPGLGNLPKLKMYNIGYNNIVSSGENGLDFITLLANSTQLNFLAFDGNQIEGKIPKSIGNLSKVLSKLYMGSNKIHGSIPSTISELTGLTLLNTSYNAITGPIPNEISLLKNLQVLDLANNSISGTIPSALSTLTKLNQLDLSGNKLMGQIPSSFGSFSSMNSMDLSSNMLNGSIPKEFFNAKISNSLKLANNRLSGELPEEIGLLNTVVAVDICNNRLSGSIPSAISNCKSLETLNLSRNYFSGNIPASIGQMDALGTLDLSKNNLSGFLPCGGVFQNLSKVRVQENPNISLQLACQEAENSPKHRAFKKAGVIIIAVAALVVLCVIVSSLIIAMKKRKSKEVGPSDSFKGQRQMVKYEELRQATEDFNERNLIGRGGFGTVFRGVLTNNNMVVAIKVLDLKLGESWKSFVSECEALRNVRHRNLVKLITSCSSLDYKNKEFVALVYEYLSNGSLDDWLKGKKRKGNGDGLGIMERLNVAIDVASALDYLHHDSEVAVVHCDVKPSNILLDEDMTAKVGDFGLATLLMEKNSDQLSISSSHVLKGSIGYMPPEYGLGVRPSTAGDTYSFGVTLLELFTGKSPNHESSTGEQNLIAWVRTRFPDHLIKAILDPTLCQELESNDYTDSQQYAVSSELTSIIEVGLHCSVDRPDERLSLRNALGKLKGVRANCCKCLGIKLNK